MPIRFDPPTLVKLRRDLMRRGRTLAELLTEVLAGKTPPALEELLKAKPGKRPAEVLREALDQIERRRILLDAGDDHFGRCDVCNVDLGLASLDEMAWADCCAEHASR